MTINIEMTETVNGPGCIKEFFKDPESRVHLVHRDEIGGECDGVNETVLSGTKQTPGSLVHSEGINHLPLYLKLAPY